MQLPQILQSSDDQAKLALTVKGILIGVVPLVLLVSNARGWHLTQSGLDSIIDALLNVVTAVFTLVSIAITMVGAVRKGINITKPVEPQFLTKNIESQPPSTTPSITP